MCLSGNVGTVEEVAREYYLGPRRFRDCLIDTACVYGGLCWLLFHDILFHDNLNSGQPLCAQFYHTPQRFYERHRNVIETRLAEYMSDPGGVFDRQMTCFRSHPFFRDPRSKIAAYSGTWLLKNDSHLRAFATMSVEHAQDALIRETMLNSVKGRNAGWPDLVAWSERSIVFAEVKSSDELSASQRSWIADHQDGYAIELIRVIEERPNKLGAGDG